MPEANGSKTGLMLKVSLGTSVAAMVYVAGGIWDIRDKFDAKFQSNKEAMEDSLDKARSELEASLRDFKGEVRDSLSRTQADMRTTSAAVNDLRSDVSAMRATVDFIVSERETGKQSGGQPR